MNPSSSAAVIVQSSFERAVDSSEKIVLPTTCHVFRIKVNYLKLILFIYFQLVLGSVSIPLATVDSEIFNQNSVA